MIYLFKNRQDFEKLSYPKLCYAAFAGYWRADGTFYIHKDRDWGTSGKIYTPEQLSSFLTYWCTF